MNTRIRRANQVLKAVQGLLLAASALAVAGFGAEAQGPARFVDQPTERRIRVSLEPADSPARIGIDAMAVPSVGGRVSHAATLHRFRVELVDSAGRPISRSESRTASWDVTLLAGAPVADGNGGMKPVVRLSNDAPDISVPRPYGVQLNADDSLLIVATVRDSSMHAVLQVTIEYESPDGPMSRLHVMSLCASEMPMGRADELFAASNTTGRAWIWRPAVDGRMVAIAGRSIAGATELVLEDAMTGEVLWSTRAQSLVPGATSAQQGEIIRPSVAVQAGRSYRLRAIYASATAAASAHGGGTPLAILLPARAPAR